ncbi:uncharacterized protein LOC117180756 [Belonocnema kinseyi]|uniref:uncharacterized protein LOC117180756 n=1 Tax=Belonocnema kinseyi TaxID=2817044 RepID=UPI00143DD76C|nr:uncharacterized protein LOC117180756 [Belonocnema kinseyi]
MQFATLCFLLAFCAFQIVHSGKDNKYIQKELDELNKNDRSQELYDFLNKKGKKTEALLRAARHAKKNTIGCQTDYDDTKYGIYLDYSNACDECIISGKKKNDYQFAVDCCDKLYKESIAKSDTLLKDAKYCLDGL